jgi:HD-like signal output (HDOD) protein
MSQDLISRIRDCPSLPSLPAVAIEVVRLTSSDTADINEVARAISSDPALSGKVLRTVNSSFYGHSQRITSIRHAAGYLGLEALRTLVLGFSIARNLADRKPKAFRYVDYWKRSIYAATAGGILAQKLHRGQHEICFLVGMLMDLGMLVLDDVVGDEYGAICSQAANHSELGDVELRTLGLTHAQASQILAEHWNLPSLLSVPMAYHHQPETLEEGMERTMAEMASLAGRCADIFVDANPAMSIAQVRRFCVERHALSEMEGDAVLCNIGRRTLELAPLFEVRLDDAASYESILKKANEALLGMTLAALAEESPSDRRRATRIKRENTVSIMPCSAGIIDPPLPACLRDVSARGMGLSCAKKMPRGRQFIIQLPQKNGKPVSLLYTVVRCESAGKGQWSIGAELACLLNTEQVTGKQTPAQNPPGLNSAAA